MDSIRKQKLNHAKRTTLALKKHHHEKPLGEEMKDVSPLAKYYSKVVMEWEPKEFREHKRNENWYLWLGIIAAIFITVAIFLKAYIVAVTFFLLAVVVVMFAQQPAKRIEVRITDTGIERNGKFHPYHKLEKFWIFYDPPHITTLNFRLKQRHLPDIHVEIEKQDPVALRDALLEYLPEDEEKEEDFTDVLARRLHF